MAPVLPGLTDSDAAIAELMRLSREHGARRVGVRMLHLKPEPKRWFLQNLRRYFPPPGTAVRRSLSRRQHLR